MAIADTDIVYRLSTKSGSAGDTTTSTPAASLGKYISTTVVSGTPLNALFDDVSGAEASAGDTEYRCFFVFNNHASLTWQNVVVWIESQVGSGANVEIGVDPAGVTPKGQSAAQASSATDESTAPSPTVTFSSACTSKGTGLSIGNIAAGSCCAIWIKRIVPSSTPAQAADGAQLRCEGDTAA